MLMIPFDPLETFTALITFDVNAYVLINDMPCEIAAPKKLFAAYMTVMARRCMVNFMTT